MSFKNIMLNNVKICNHQDKQPSITVIILINQATLSKKPLLRLISVTIHYDEVAAQQQKVRTVLGTFSPVKSLQFVSWNNSSTLITAIICMEDLLATYD